MFTRNDVHCLTVCIRVFVSCHFVYYVWVFFQSCLKLRASPTKATVLSCLVFMGYERADPHRRWPPFP